MITHYFNLQRALLIRHLQGFGINPILGFMGAIVLFTIFSILFFQRVGYPHYIYSFLPMFFVGALGRQERTDFLKTCYNKKQFFIIRSLENGLIGLPFCFFLCSKGQFLISLCSLFLSFLMVFTNVFKSSNLTIPTPFGKHPFEFTIGFRQSFFVIFGIYALTGIAVYVNNFNLGLFALLSLGLMSAFFYNTTEPLFFVWVDIRDEKRFILNKIKVAILYSTLLSVPITVSLILFQPSEIWMVLGFQVLVYLYVLLGLLGKYAAYPSDLNIKQAFAIGLCYMAPPMLVFIIPVFYKHALGRLKPILK